jgi:hypothetical protein
VRRTIPLKVIGANDAQPTCKGRQLHKNGG